MRSLWLATCSWKPKVPGTSPAAKSFSACNYITMAINLMSFKDTNGTRAMHAKSDNIKIIISNKTNEMIERFFD